MCTPRIYPSSGWVEGGGVPGALSLPPVGDAMIEVTSKRKRVVIKVVECIFGMIARY